MAHSVSAEDKMARRAKEKPAKRVNKKMLEAKKAVMALPEIETFYSFILENDLREEAQILIQSVLNAKKKPSKARMLQ
jgi:hypothetical protein